jgi:hypothetical protein
MGVCAYWKDIVKLVVLNIARVKGDDINAELF